jgi:FKBP-type peptidyl-prolyl cis-trans isomerase SlyD
MAATQTIENGCLVTLKVAMFDAQGQLLERGETPLAYLHGAGDIFAAIERALAGKAAGAKLSVALDPDDAFGDYDAERVHLVATDELGDGAEIGMRFEGLPDREDDELIYTVTDIADGMAVLDGNHPLAGLALRFDIDVLEVRRLSAAEIEEAERPQLPEFLGAGSAPDSGEPTPPTLH